jgi:hypothetical protein
MEVGDFGASVEFNCGHGQLPGPLFLDANNHFAVTGTITIEHVGPMIVGDDPVTTFPANYEGQVEGESMRLTTSWVDHEGLPQARTDDLLFGTDGHLGRCG